MSTNTNTNTEKYKHADGWTSDEIFRSMRRNAEQYKKVCKENISLKKELHFYQSLFKTHCNSAVFNLYSKTINGEKVWIDPIIEHGKLHLLDKDEEVEEWLKPVKFER
jgi:hypothetical protein